MLVHNEIALIAACLFKRGGIYQTGTQRMYMLEGEEVDGSTARYVVHTIEEARTFAKTYSNKMARHEYIGHLWPQWCAARKQIIDNAHGEGTYDKFMERILR